MHCYLDLVNIKSDILPVSNTTEQNKSLDNKVLFAKVYSNKTQT